MNRRTIVVTLAAVAVCAFCAAPADLVINEVAWGGTAADYTHEWIELVNATDRPIDLTGWRLVSTDGAPDVRLSGTLLPRSDADPEAGYFLLERDSDSAVPGLSADAIYAGALSDGGEGLLLYDPDGVLVDSANAPDGAASARRPWPGGTGGPGEPHPCSMERVNPLADDEDANWATSRRPEDLDGAAPPCGTPKRENATYNLPPTASMTIEPRHPRPSESIQFDASSSTDRNDRIAAFVWTFGDGAAAVGQTASHTYTAAGEYEVVLTVRDETGAIDSATRFLPVFAPVPPHADFSLLGPAADVPLRAGEPFTVHDETSHAQAELVRWTWDFGDGTTAEGALTTHTYTAAGMYTIRLEVVDAQGSVGERTDRVAVASRIPRARFTVATEQPDDIAPVLFDASASTDPDGEIVSFEWDFDGDGTVDLAADAPRVEHVYASPGPATPTLVVVDSDGDRSESVSTRIFVNAAPTAQFTVTTFSPTEATSVGFTDASFDTDGTIATWCWDFGDGTSSNETSPTHAFEGSGAHTVTLTVVDDQGTSAAATATLDVANLPPTASIATCAAEGATGDAFTFDASASDDPSPNGSIVSYAWDLDGDGAADRETTTPSLSHVYADDGVYVVSVRVTDDDGAAYISEAIRVTVRNRAPTVLRIIWTPERPTDGDAVLLTAEVSDPDGEVVGWEWTLGREATSAEPEPQHAFAYDVVHTIRLTVHDDDGAASEPAHVEIDVANALPIAEFTLAEIAPRTIAFSASLSNDPSANGRIVHVAWDFGDGTRCPESPASCGEGDRTAPIHVYALPGTYAVTLIVIDDDGGIGRITKTLTIP